MSDSAIVRHGVTQRWSDAVIHGGVIYFVEVADDPNQNAAGQIDQVLKQAAARLKHAGSDLTKLLLVQIYLPNPNDLAAFNTAWDAWIPAGHAPARACIHARLASEKLLVELVITAAVSQ